MKKMLAVWSLILLLLPLPGLIAHAPDLLSENREELLDQALGLREEMLALHAALSRLMGMSGSDQVALGRDGTLFLAETLPEAVGEETLSDEETERIAQRLAALDRSLRARGAYLIFLCAPNKASLCPSALPYYALPRTGESALDALLQKLAAAGVACVNVRQALSAQARPYLRTDTHWSDASARLIYRALMDRLPAATHERYEAPAMEQTRVTGDLTALIDPGYGETEAVERAVVPRAYRTEGVMRTVMDLRIETACDRNALRVILLRDSFANALFPYLANNIGSLRLIRAARWEESFWREGTDAVILEIAERDLRRLLDDPAI